MLAPRIIPCLLVHNKGLVKTKQFADPKYVGDPINAVKIFNEKSVDELMVLNIDATVEGEEPNYEMIAKLSAECRMPLCYGGGVSTVAQVKKILSLGVEKVALSAAAINNPGLLGDIAAQVGAQSVVLVLDVRKRRFGRQYDIYTHRGKRKASTSLFDFLDKLPGNVIGELVINHIERDGMMTGYDLPLIQRVFEKVACPVTVLGGAGSLADLKSLTQQHPIVGAAAGSLFVFKGVYRAVLINYPSGIEKEQLLGEVQC